MRGLLLSLLLGVLVSSAGAATETLTFDTPQQEEDYRGLVAELRCLVCQNQNLADSDAELAQDLRKQVYKMITEEGADKKAVIDYMVLRYGDFVLYRPPLKGNTLVLWLGPLLLLLVGLFVAVRIVRAMSKTKAPANVDLSEVKNILNSKEKS